MFTKGNGIDDSISVVDQFCIHGAFFAIHSLPQALFNFHTSVGLSTEGLFVK